MTISTKTKTKQAVALACAALTSLCALSACSTAPAGPAPDGTAQTSSAASNAADGATASSPTPSQPKVTGKPVKGTGWSARIPTGWNDGTREYRDRNPNLETLDRVFLLGAETFKTARVSVIVETSPRHGATARELTTNWKQALVYGDAGAKIKPLPHRPVGGVTTTDAALIHRTNSAGVRVQQVAFLLVRGDQIVSITISGKKTDDRGIDEARQVLDTWTWTWTAAQKAGA